MLIRALILYVKLRVYGIYCSLYLVGAILMLNKFAYSRHKTRTRK